MSVIKPAEIPCEATGDLAERRVDAGDAGETVLALGNSADRHRLRNELLRLIVKNESRRKLERLARPQEVVTTDGLAVSQVGSAKA